MTSLEGKWEFKIHHIQKWKGGNIFCKCHTQCSHLLLFIPERFHVTSGNSSLGICSDKRNKKMFESTATNWSIFQWKQSIFKLISKGTIQAQMHLLWGRYRGCVQHGKGDPLNDKWYFVGRWGGLLPIPKLIFDKMQGFWSNYASYIRSKDLEK